MSTRIINLIALSLLALMLGMAFTSMEGISATMDELAHIPAGYSYLSQQDFRINPEHPPLAKDLAAAPLLLLNLNFPQHHPSWTEQVNGQWWLGSKFLYRSGNNPNQIIFWSRIPMLLLLLFLGWFLFHWAQQLGGTRMAFMVLALFSFSPTFLAHGRLVTTDVAAALGFGLATFFWLKWLRKPSKKNIISAGLIFGAAMLLKFSLVLLIPFFVIVTLAYIWLNKKPFLNYIGIALLVALIGLVLIGAIYQFHILNYPAQRQLSDTKTLLASTNSPLKPLCIWMADKPGFRPLAHYLLGLLMATQRTTSGNTVYFMGMISGTGWWYYFPVVYFLKVPLALHILTLAALLSAVSFINKPFWIKTGQRLKRWLTNHFTEFSMLIFLAIYWITSIKGNLNIGVRHILPVFPFLYLLVSLGIKNWFEKLRQPPLKVVALVVLILSLGWYLGSSVWAWPHYLSYFNRFGGGSEQGYKYVVDSNYDWGQDLKRLKKWVTERDIDKIYVDYFGGGDPAYSLEQRYKKWKGTNPKSEFPSGNYLAVSATLLQGGRGNPVPGYNQPTGYYRWLNNQELVARAGNSIFIYYIE